MNSKKRAERLVDWYRKSPRIPSDAELESAISREIRRAEKRGAKRERESCAITGAGASFESAMEITAWMGLPQPKRIKWATTLGEDVSGAIRARGEKVHG